jgi:toxin YoeB
MYEIEFSREAIKHVLLMRKSSLQLYKKLEKLLDELREHPYTGTGHPEQLKYLDGVWSRQLDKKNRIRYIVNESTIVVFVVSALGHYDDK